MLLAKIINQFTQTILAVQMAHWSVRDVGSYAFHVNSGDLIGALQGHFDELIEALLSISAYSDAMSSVVTQIPSAVYGDARMCKQTSVAQVRVLEDLLKSLESETELTGHTEVFNLRDEILSSIRKFYYKLQFK
jgi:DNA-binding ferritin-like protein